MTAVHDLSSASPSAPQARPHHLSSANSKAAMSNGVEKQLVGQEKQSVAKLSSECAVVHCKNDSGSFEGSNNLLSKSICGSQSSSSGCGSVESSGVGSPKQNHHVVTILVTNGNSDGGDGVAHSAPPPRTTSAASIHSSSCQGSTYHSSSSSSLSHDLSANNSAWNSHEMLEQLLVGVSGEEKSDSQEIIQQLLEHIVTLKLELEGLKQENEKLRAMRTTMDDELHTLTENLFEEAYKMVDTVKEEKGAVTKKLADATGKMDAMETKMSALKNLLQPTPADGQHKKGGTGGGEEGGGKSSSQHHKHHRPNVKKAIRKLSRKVKSSTMSSSSKSASASSVLNAQHLTLVEHKNEIKGASLNEGQLVPGELSGFSEWLSESVRADHPYLLHLEDTDVRPCLDFRNKELSSRLLPVARKNDLVMESLGPCAEGETRVCSLSECRDVCCTHRMQLGSSDQWLFISQHCRNRIAAACDFYMYIGHIEKGFIKLDAEQLYWQVSRLRAMMNLARLSLELPD